MAETQPLFSTRSSATSYDGESPYNTSEKPRTYKRRWLVLFTFCFLSIMNNLTQYSFTPITNLTKNFYVVSDLQVNLLAVVFMVTGFTTRFAAMWIIDNKGLAHGVFISAGLNFVGSWMRYFPGGFESGTSSYYWLLFGQSLCAIAQSFIDITGPKVAANWFPPKERTTATALSSGPIFLALLLAYAIVPHTVKRDSDLPIYLLVEAGLTTAATILVFLFFRGNPPIPPSYSAQVDKLKFADAFKILFKNKNFIIMFLVFAITLGSALAFSVVMDQVVEPAGYSNTEASTLGSIWISCSILGGIIGGPIIDRTRAYKAFIVITLSLATIGTTVFTLVLSYAKHDMLALAFIIAFVGLGAAGVPAILEATIETIYPVPEASAMGILFLGLNITGVIFVLGMEKLKDPKTGSMTTSMWCVVALCIIGTGLVCFFKPDYQRLQYEKMREEQKIARELQRPPEIVDQDGLVNVAINRSV